MKNYQLDIELFEGYMCPGIPVTEDLSIEVEFSDEEVTKIRQLVKDYTGDKRAGLMPILKNDAPELHERIAKAAFQEIYDFYLLDGLRNGYIELDEADQQRNFKKDLESGEFNPEEFIEDSVWYEVTSSAPAMLPGLSPAIPTCPTTWTSKTIRITSASSPMRSILK